MKYIYSIILMLVCFQYGFAQSGTSDLNIPDFLSDNEQYFTDAKLKNGGTLELQAKETYFVMEQSKKNVIIEIALKKWNGEMIFIHAGYNREIWRRDITTGQITLIGQWDLNNAEIYKYLPKTLQTTKFHPFFFYVGGQTNFNSDKFTLLLSARIGSFLYKDRWDLALSGSLSVIDNDVNSTTNAELGFLSKVYFPIRKHNISPYVGVGISRVFTNLSMEYGTEYADFDNSYWDKMLLLGISWYVGSGSLDFGAQIVDNFNLTLGYTFSF
ncbi:MAG: hypothetical protein PHG27_06755 [Massilibacteroides sp.]|nr:hypothetical protein [Massilibacteroides sp.]MDD3061758.1 hypothetical protein [Massilibacteroides sp.]MDD4115280.1 hypothetical protein [Massilibacteroides sp.]MDD4660402.1 hypothetical protein [Massilibacteroides sp.]